MLLHCMGRRSPYGYMSTLTMLVTSTLIGHKLDSSSLYDFTGHILVFAEE